ncbi:MAG: methionyl-tRNA formyltransferase [Candidatus Omnitrophota bacterium]
MRIVFFGTGKFALVSLKKLLKSDHEIVGVVTRPDSKKGRGWHTQPGLIKALIENAAPGMDIFQPDKMSDDAFLEDLKKINAEVFVVIDYGKYLPQKLLDIPAKYCINLHPSLLPEYRGASPVNSVILNGEAKTGNTVFKLSESMDAGDVIVQEETEIRDSEDSVELLERLSQSGAGLLVEALDLIKNGKEKLKPQDESKAVYSKKISKKDGLIDWTRSSQEIDRKIRGMKPWPGAFTSLDGKNLKIIKAKIEDKEVSAVIAGTICDNKKFIIKTGDTGLEVLELQLEGKKAMTAKEFLKGYNLKKGMLLG